MPRLLNASISKVSPEQLSLDLRVIDCNSPGVGRKLESFWIDRSGHDDFDCSRPCGCVFFFFISRPLWLRFFRALVAAFFSAPVQAAFVSFGSLFRVLRQQRTLAFFVLLLLLSS